MVLENIALTGSSGLLGRHISSILLKNHYKVIASSRRKSPIKHSNLIWKKMDFNKNINKEILDKMFGSVSTIIHAGAHVPGNDKKISKKAFKKCNILATEKLARWATNRNIHFIYISGAIVYKDKNKINTENSTTYQFSKDIYCNSKILSEKKLLFYKKKGLSLTIFRPSSIYGWGLRKSKIICKFINFSKKKKKINIYNPDKTNINLIHAHDVSNAILKSLKKKINGIFNLGNTKVSNFYHVARTCNHILKNKKKIKIIKRNKVSSINMLHTDIKKAKKVLNWKPKIILHQGLVLMVENKCS